MQCALHVLHRLCLPNILSFHFMVTAWDTIKSKLTAVLKGQIQGVQKAWMKWGLIYLLFMFKSPHTTASWFIGVSHVPSMLSKTNFWCTQPNLQWKCAVMCTLDMALHKKQVFWCLAQKQVCAMCIELQPSRNIPSLSLYLISLRLQSWAEIEKCKCDWESIRTLTSSGARTRAFWQFFSHLHLLHDSKWAGLIFGEPEYIQMEEKNAKQT